MDLNDIPVFLKVAETGSFSSAARVLGLPKATVSRRVARLEAAVGVRLVNRTTRALSLTDAGRHYFEETGAAMAAMEAATLRTAAAQEEPSGTIRISGPADVDFLSEIVAGFLERYPRIRAELVLTDQHLDLVEEGIDVAIRAGRLADSSLVARKLAPSCRSFVASPSYLAARGTPQTPADLAGHDCIVFGRLAGATWLVRGPDGPETIPVSGRIAVNTMQFAVRAAVAGLGIALMPSPLAARAVREGRLVAILHDFEPPHGGLYAVYPGGRHLSMAVRAFVDFAAEGLSWLGPPPDLAAPAARPLSGSAEPAATDRLTGMIS